MLVAATLLPSSPARGEGLLHEAGACHAGYRANLAQMEDRALEQVELGGELGAGGLEVARLGVVDLALEASDEEGQAVALLGQQLLVEALGAGQQRAVGGLLARRDLEVAQLGEALLQ